MTYKYLLILLAVYTSNCCSVSDDSSTAATDYEKLYQDAIENSIYPEKSKVFANLVSINDKNQDLIRKSINNEEFILVLAWKGEQVVNNVYRSQLDTVFNTGNYPIWVTTANELRDRFNIHPVKDTSMRLKQLLGLPPNASYSYFVEFWVKQNDLFRPCPDKEIVDKVCNCYFPDSVDEHHKLWINENRISRYYNRELYNQYPWTQLGYTYDWSPENESHIGLSEFVIDTNANVFINKIYSTNEYLNSK